MVQLIYDACFVRKIISLCPVYLFNTFLVGNIPVSCVNQRATSFTFFQYLTHLVTCPFQRRGWEKSCVLFLVYSFFQRSANINSFNLHAN